MSKKEIKVISGDVSKLKISQVEEHVIIRKPKNTKKPIVIPKENKKTV